MELLMILSTVRTEDDARLLSAQDAESIIEFNPSFTYPIFGEHEKIFGYKDLDIQVSAASRIKEA